MVNIPYGNAGIASYETGPAFTTTELFHSLTPEPFTEDFPVAINTTLEKNSVVGLSSGNLVMAVSGTTVPIGVTLHKVVTGGATDRIAIYRAGNFNRDALVWDASYSTNALKEAAFRGSPAPTNVVVRARL